MRSPARVEAICTVFHFVLVTGRESVGVFSFARSDWQPDDIIPKGMASLRLIDVIPPDPRDLDGLEVGILKAESV